MMLRHTGSILTKSDPTILTNVQSRLRSTKIRTVKLPELAIMQAIWGMGIKINDAKAHISRGDICAGRIG